MSRVLSMMLALLALFMAVSAQGDEGTTGLARKLNWRGGDRVDEYGGCYYYGQKPACCRQRNAKGEKMFCFLQNPFYAQCLTVAKCKASGYPNCSTRARCAADVIPQPTAGLAEFSTCFTPWEQGGVKGCCAATNAAGEQLYCFYQNSYYAQCLTQARCQSDGYKDCGNTNSCAV